MKLILQNCLLFFNSLTNLLRQLYRRKLRNKFTFEMSYTRKFRLVKRRFRFSVTFRACKNIAARRIRNDSPTQSAAHRNASASKMPLAIRSVCAEKKKREKRGKKETPATAAAILWMTPLYLSVHQSGIMRAAWLEMRDFDEIGCVVNRGLNVRPQWHHSPRRYRCQ